MRGVPVAGENKDGHRPDLPVDVAPETLCAGLRDTHMQRIADNQDETRKTVPFAPESEAIRVRITSSEYVRAALVTHLSSLKPQNKGVVRGVMHPGFEHTKHGCQCSCAR
jgi:hypothetical protein